MNKRILAASLSLLTTASVAQAATYTVAGFGSNGLSSPLPYGPIVSTWFLNDRGLVVGDAACGKTVKPRGITARSLRVAGA